MFVSLEFRTCDTVAITHIVLKSIHGKTVGLVVVTKLLHTQIQKDLRWNSPPSQWNYYIVWVWALPVHSASLLVFDEIVLLTAFTVDQIYLFTESFAAYTIEWRLEVLSYVY